MDILQKMRWIICFLKRLLKRDNMRYLYKYTPHNAEYKYDIITKSQLWFSKVENFNDPINGFIPLGFFGLVFLSIIINSGSKKIKNVFLYKISRSSLVSSFFAFFTFVISEAFTTYNLLFAIIIFIVVFIFNYIITKNVDFNNLSIKEYTGSSGLGGFSSSSSGGFSGGGGSFGGGGASGDW